MTHSAFPPEIQRLYDKSRADGQVPLGNVFLMAKLASEVIPMLDLATARAVAQAFYKIAMLAGKLDAAEGGERGVAERIASEDITVLASVVETLILLINAVENLGFVQSLLSKALEMEGHEIIHSHFERMASLDPFASFINTVNNSEDGVKRVLFVARRPFFQILREATHLRKDGWRAFLVFLEDASVDYESAFERALRIPNHLWFLEKLIERMEPDVIHVQCMMWDFVLGASVIRTNRKCPCICEFYDVTSVYAPRDALARNWPAEDVDFDLAMEAVICRESDAVITRFPEPVHEELRQRYECQTPMIEFSPYPCPEYSSFSDRKASDSDGAVRLVYAGGLIPQNEDHPKEIFPERKQPSTFKRLIDQGLNIDVYCAPHQLAHENRTTFEAFFQFAEENPRFRLLEGVAPHLLAGNLMFYDFGLILCEMDLNELQVSESMMKWCVGTKLFAYQEAGLPIIVNAEYEYMASIVEDNNLGFAVSSGEIPTVAERIRSFDYKSSVAAIKRYREEHGMEREIKRMEALYKEVLGAGAKG